MFGLTVLIFSSSGQQVNITSDLVESGRNYSCLHEVVTYYCSVQGFSLTVDALPYINRIFLPSDPVPSTQLVPNAVLTLDSGSPDFSARLELNVTQSANVTCSASGISNTLPLVVFTSKQLTVVDI